jgi:hypothetical protein
MDNPRSRSWQLRPISQRWTTYLQQQLRAVQKHAILLRAGNAMELSAPYSTFSSILDDAEALYNAALALHRAKGF